MTLLALLLLTAGTDVTPDVSLVAALPPWQQIALTLLAGYLASVVASFWSDYVRRLGKQAKPWQLSLSSALNLAAGNPHKAARAAKAARE